MNWRMYANTIDNNSNAVQVIALIIDISLYVACMLRLCLE